MPRTAGRRTATGTIPTTGTTTTGSGLCAFQLTGPGGCRPADPDGILSPVLSGAKTKHPGGAGSLNGCLAKVPSGFSTQKTKKEVKMETITAALLAAIAAGATEVGQSALVDAYKGVKALIQRKFQKTDLPGAIESLEKKPTSRGRQETVKEEVESANADKDPEIMKEIERLIEVIEQTPNVQEKLAKYHLTINNSKIGSIGDHVTIEGGIHIS
jgi:hypothetical protein